MVSYKDQYEKERLVPIAGGEVRIISIQRPPSTDEVKLDKLGKTVFVALPEDNIESLKILYELQKRGFTRASKTSHEFSKAYCTESEMKKEIVELIRCARKHGFNIVAHERLLLVVEPDKETKVLRGKVRLLNGKIYVETKPGFYINIENYICDALRKLVDKTVKITVQAEE